MKYGDQLEQESVPEWSLHNIDYNSLKHEIKVHTTRDQATAIAIPGHLDSALKKFEDGLYLELCRQHDRVDLFVGSKANEISRRLDYVADQIQRLSVKCVEDTGPRMTLRRQRRFARYERELLRCGEDTLALGRFINAQIVAFRKITKKYKKWTGSNTLGSRFRENILSNPKSFTRREFHHLQNRYEELLTTLRAITPQMSEPSSPSSDELRVPIPPPTQSEHLEVSEFPPLPPSQPHYWNEYDDGSERGEQEDDGYAIYITPGEDFSFPGLASVQAIIKLPFDKAKSWFTQRDPARRRLLDPSSANGNGNGAFIGGYGGLSPIGTETDEEYASSEDIPVSGYAAHYAALPSINDQRVALYRERALFWGTIGSFAGSFILLGIAGLLIVTGRHKLRIEVDAGVAVGAMASLFFACLALGLSIYHRDPLAPSHRAAVWMTFITVCVLNGMLLILVVGNTA